MAVPGKCRARDRLGPLGSGRRHALRLERFGLQILGGRPRCPLVPGVFNLIGLLFWRIEIWHVVLSDQRPSSSSASPEKQKHLNRRRRRPRP